MKKSTEKLNRSSEEGTYISGDLIMEGTLNGGDYPVVVDGHFKGDIVASELILREKGVVVGSLKAETVEISGHFSGDLICENLSVLQTGVVEGDVQAGTLSIDLGAEMIGSVSKNS